MFKRKLKVRQNEIRYKEPEVYQVGETTIELTFEDKKKFRMRVIGRVYQWYDAGRDEGAFSLEEPRADEKPTIVQSTELARMALGNLNREVGTYLDSQENPKEARIGRVIGAKILGTHGHTVKFATAYIAKKEG